MTERGNSRDLTRARHAAMYLARRLTGKSTTVIGRAFDRDHTTVMNGIERAQNAFRHDPAFRSLIDAARRAIAKAIPPDMTGDRRLTKDGKFKSDKYEWCPEGFFALKFTNPRARDAIRFYALSMTHRDPELAKDLRAACEAARKGGA